MKAYVTQISYCVPLSDAQWFTLTRRDESGDERDDIIPALLKAGVVSGTIEYNGHFGRNIFFAVEKEAHLARVLKRLEKLLK